LAAITSGPTWVLQHRPIWSPGGAFGGQLVGDNKTLAAAATGVIPDNVTAILSGHHHLFQVLAYTTKLPLQVLAGHGGDYLNDGFAPDPAGWVVNGVTVKNGVNAPGVFGFALMEKRGDGWKITSHDRNGGALTSCLLVGRSANCPAN